MATAARIGSMKASITSAAMAITIALSENGIGLMASQADSASLSAWAM